MPDPGDELERILLEMRSQLGKVSLNLPSLEEGGAAQPSPEAWAAASLEPPRAPAALRAAAQPPPPAAPLRSSAKAADAPPPPSVDVPPPSAGPGSGDRRRGPRRTMLAVAAGAIVLAVGVWWNLPTRADQVLPVASFDAVAARGANEWIVARQKDLLLYDASFKPRALAQAPAPLTSIFWIEGALYASGGKNTLFHWGKMDEPPQTFPLDHTPVAIYARPPHVWTLDKSGSLRQFLLSRSMTGVFLQPLDRAETSLSGDFSLAEDGALFLLERSSGNLLRLTRKNSSYAVTSRGASYGAGARLLSTGRGLLIARADGEKTTVVSVRLP